MNRTDLQKLIDACRSDADLRLPEFRPLAELIASEPSVRRSWEKSQKIDTAIRQAVRDVPVPEGLEGRLLDSVFGAISLSTHVTGPAGEKGAGREVDMPALVAIAGGAAQGLIRSQRSNWKAWTVALTGIAALLLAWFALRPNRESPLATHDDVIQQASQWIDQVKQTGWRSDAPPGNYPLPVQFNQSRYPWQSVSAGSLRVICYDLASKGPRARLFVAWTTRTPNLDNQPPKQAYQLDRNWSAAAWKTTVAKGSYVYVLAVRNEDKQQYQRLIGPRPNVAVSGRAANKSCASGRV